MNICHSHTHTHTHSLQWAPNIHTYIHTHTHTHTHTHRHSDIYISFTLSQTHTLHHTNHHTPTPHKQCLNNLSVFHTSPITGFFKLHPTEDTTHTHTHRSVIV